MAHGTRHDIPQKLAGALPPGVVLGDGEARRTAVDGVVPVAAVRPRSVDEVARVLALAHQERWAVAPVGGGTMLGLGMPPRALDVALLTTGLVRVLEHAPADLVCTVEAGVPLGALQATLRREGQSLPLQAPAPSRATIGGVLATGVSGPLRLGYGLPRDWVIGMRVAHPGGTVTRAGGKVVKNVTGFDLCRVYTGSLGTLGVIVEASFKLAPLPAASRTVAAAFATLDGALAAAEGLLALAFVPSALEVVDAATAAAADAPTAAPAGGAVVLARLDGSPAGVARRVDEASRSLRALGAAGVEALEGEAAELWDAVASLGWEEGAAGTVLRANVPASATGALARELSALASAWGVTVVGLTAGVGFGTVRAAVAGPERGVLAVVAALRAWVSRWEGTVVVERCDAALKAAADVWGPPPGGLDVMRRLKEAFDPAGVLNPGRFVGGL